MLISFIICINLRKIGSFFPFGDMFKYISFYIGLSSGMISMSSLRYV